MSSLERRKLCCSVTFHAVSIITAIMWSWWQMWSIMIMIMRRRRRSNIMAKALCTSISLSHCLNTNIVFSLRHLYHLVWKPPPCRTPDTHSLFILFFLSLIFSSPGCHNMRRLVPLCFNRQVMTAFVMLMLVKTKIYPCVKM